MSCAGQRDLGCGGERCWAMALARQTGACRMGACRMGVCQTGACQMGACQTGVCQTGACQTGACQTGARQTGACQTGARQTGACRMGACQMGVCQTGACQTGVCQMGACQMGVCQMGLSASRLVHWQGKGSSWCLFLVVGGTIGGRETCVWASGASRHAHRSQVTCGAEFRRVGSICGCFNVEPQVLYGYGDTNIGQG